MNSFEGTKQPLSQSHSQLSSALENCANELNELHVTEPKRPPLRMLQRVAHVLAQSRCDPYIMTVSFLLDVWIEDFYYNFVGDILSKASVQVDEVRTAFLRKQVAPALQRLGRAVLAERDKTFFAFEDLITAYIEAVATANKTLKEL